METCSTSILVSLCFEVSQAVFSIGTFDVDDLLVNTFGRMLGYVISKSLHR
ncbi:VanZ family protein [Peribacillus castrilensis]|uniref:VanZ family protein n=1 Tax=Bacillaceae TaxID=186817 RepID=UPI0009BE41C9|nr:MULTISPECIES: VanZ family protein [Bacillaceae]MCP1095326.1 VanZ family protein [Bacillaceae bacterium OS4b]MBD8588501.1 VanZ family protein [Peribacillus simplex]MCF7620300.1 VanZ family protein [Peribacillus frigoritolerans]MCP1151047.1 VanZ family protein [Peribacillus frigoritolerans]MCT1389280.1 VanZ family protein [Peribacillus frigoritolerans]